MKISLFTLFLLLVLPRAFAEGLVGTYPLTPMPKAECAATLKELFAPEEAIKAGIGAIAGLNIDGGAISSCVDEMASDPTAFPRPVNIYGYRIPVQRIARDLQDIERKMRCTIPQSSPEEQEYFKKNRAQQCENKFFSVEEGKDILAERQRLQKINGLFKYLSYAISNPQYEAKGKLRAEQKKLEYCKKNPYAANSAWFQSFQNKADSICEGKTFDDDELKAQAKLVTELEQKLYAQLGQDSALRNKLEEILYTDGYVIDYFYDRTGELLPVVQNLVCLGPPQDSPDYSDWQWRHNGFCDPKPLTGDFEQARAALLEKLGDLDVLRTNVKASNKEAEDRQKALQKLSDEKRFRTYGFRRLLAQFQYYLNHGGSSAALDPFCEKYAQDMLRDKSFIEQEYPNKYKLGLANFDDDGSWEKVKKHGLTEGEYTALSRYVGSFYGTVNPPLFKKEGVTPAITAFRDELNSALSKIPAYDGGRPVKRFAQLNDEILSQHKVGSVVTYDSFTSTSKNKGWHWNGNTQFLIFTAKGGKDLQDYNQGEGEVLFPAGSHFKVLSKEKDGKKTSLVMVETDANGKPLASVSPVTKEEKQFKARGDDDDDDYPKKKKKGGKKK